MVFDDTENKYAGLMVVQWETKTFEGDTIKAIKAIKARSETMKAVENKCHIGKA